MIKSTQSILKSIDESEYPNLLKSIRVFSSISKEVGSSSDDLIMDSSSGAPHRANLRSFINENLRSEKEINFRSVIIEAYQIETVIKEILDNGTLPRSLRKFSNILNRRISSFIDEYEIYKKSSNFGNCLKVAAASSRLEESLIISKYSLEIINDLSESAHETKGFEKTDIYLANVEDLKSFSNKLKCIDNLYNDLVELTGVSGSDFPAIINHIENGSLWLKISGHPAVIGILTTIVANAAIFYQSEFTTSGKLSSIPPSVQAANELLQLSDQLKARGLDTDELDSRLESITRKISRNLDELLGDQPEIEINEKQINIGSALSQKMIEESKQKRLTHKPAPIEE